MTIFQSLKTKMYKLGLGSLGSLHVGSLYICTLQIQFNRPCNSGLVPTNCKSSKGTNNTYASLSFTFHDFLDHDIKVMEPEWRQPTLMTIILPLSPYWKLFVIKFSWFSGIQYKGCRAWINKWGKCREYLPLSPEPVFHLPKIISSFFCAEC